MADALFQQLDKADYAIGSLVGNDVADDLGGDGADKRNRTN